MSYVPCVSQPGGMSTLVDCSPRHTLRNPRPNLSDVYSVVLASSSMMSGEFKQVPGREGRGVHLASGQRFRLVDLEGGQVADTWAFCSDDISEYQSAEHTRVQLSRLLPRVGEQFFTNRRRPILFFEEDSTPGFHDMLLASCDPSRYATLHVEGWHASCQENLHRVMTELGFDGVETPQPINFFMKTPVEDEEGRIGWHPAETRAGDYVTLRAELDLFLIVSACPQDLVDINRHVPTAIGIEVL